MINAISKQLLLLPNAFLAGGFGFSLFLCFLRAFVVEALGDFFFVAFVVEGEEAVEALTAGGLGYGEENALFGGSP